MKIACISDLHIGDTGNADSFRHSENLFLRFLDYLEDRNDLIVLNGDIFETHKSRIPGRHLEQLERIREKYPALTERFSWKNYILISGNHDCILEKLGYPQSHLITGENNDRYLFLHGHQFDPIRSAGKIPPTVTWAFGWLERLGWKNAESHFSWLDEEIGNITGGNNVFLLDDGARSLCARSPCNSSLHVIMGHTHERPRIAFIDENVYINTGACLKGRLQFAQIDTHNRENRVFNYSITNRFGIALSTKYPACS